MCAPVLPALAIASSVISAGGQVMAGKQAKAQAKHEARMAQANAALEIESAHESFLSGKDERLEFWRKIGQVKGQQRASMAANNIEVDTDTAGRVQDDTAMLADEDAKRLYKNIEQRTRGSYINASNFVTEAKAARARGKSAMISSVIGAVGTLMGGASQAAQLKAKMGTK